MTASLPARYCPSARRDDASPSNAIVPTPRPWLPDHVTAAGLSMTLAACKVALSAILSKRSAALARLSRSSWHFGDSGPLS
jgi:hypothetical protein